LHDLIHRLQGERELTVFLITHDLAEAEKLCDRVALMHRGRLRTVGPPAALRETLRPQRVYRLRVQGMETAEAATAVLAPLRPRLPSLAYAAGELSFRAGEEGMVTAVIDHLRRHQIEIRTITATPPSLEEVFAHYTEMDGDA
jgi:ABC-2 type transport system ATP-binding protein